ncbi:MAG: phage portal protein [Chloroflexi bacterium]|nr:phage portal protein [Chloroflexota bacterium]
MPPIDDLPKKLRNRDSARRRRYDENLQFYRGAQWNLTPTQATLNRRGRRQQTYNYVRTFITKSASYTMNGMHSVVDEQDQTPHAINAANAAMTALRQVADQNGLPALDFDTELDCSVLGDAAYKVTWDTTAGRVRVTAPDITGVHAWRRPDDTAEIWRVAQRYTLPADDAATLYDITSTRREPEIIEEWTTDAFRLWVDGTLTTDAPNPYGFIPYIIYPNIREPKDTWGTSDIPALREAAQELNRVMTQLSLIAELSGAPITVLEGITESTDIGITPGAVWELPPASKAYLLDLLSGGGARVVLDYAQLVRSTLHDLGESPRSAFGDNTRGLSGVALNVELDPLVKKTQRKRIIRERAFRERDAMILALLGKYAQLDAAAAAHPTRIDWGDVLPNDRSREIADTAVLVNTGAWTRKRASAAFDVDDPQAEFAAWLEEAESMAGIQPRNTPTAAKPPAAHLT